MNDDNYGLHMFLEGCVFLVLVLLYQWFSKIELTATGICTAMILYGLLDHFIISRFRKKKVIMNIYGDTK